MCPVVGPCNTFFCFSATKGFSVLWRKLYGKHLYKKHEEQGAASSYAKSIRLLSFLRLTMRYLCWEIKYEYPGCFWINSFTPYFMSSCLVQNTRTSPHFSDGSVVSRKPCNWHFNLLWIFLHCEQQCDIPAIVCKLKFVFSHFIKMKHNHAQNWTGNFSTLRTDAHPHSCSSLCCCPCYTYVNSFSNCHTSVRKLLSDSQ